MTQQRENCRILIIDDMKDARTILRKMLENIGFNQIEMLESAEKALRAIEDDQHFDIIFSDYNMGERMNGQQLLEELHGRKLIGYGTIFVIATAETSREMVLGALECRPDAYIAKPFNLSTIEKNVARLLQEKQLLEQVIHADRDGRQDEAVGLCRQLLADKGVGNLKLGRFYAELLNDYGHYQQAFDAYSQCRPSNMPDWAGLGQARALLGLERLPEAIAILDGLVSTVTTEMPVYDLLAQIKLKQLEPAEAQDVLAKALSLSPNTFVRQKNFAQLCLDNGDTDSAIRASKHAIKLGRFSSHACTDNQVVLGQAQLAHAKRLGDEEATRLMVEAEANLAAACQQDDCGDWTRISHELGRALLATRRGEQAERDSCTDHAINTIENCDVLTEQDMPVIIGSIKSLQDLQRPEAADNLLHRLAKVFHDDQALLQRLDRIASEPLSTEGKKKAAAINRSGIALYKKRDFPLAIANFDKGTRLLPNCVELQLNYVLSAVSMMENGGRDEASLKQCQQRLQLVRSMGDIEKYRDNLAKISARLDQLA